VGRLQRVATGTGGDGRAAEPTCSDWTDPDGMTRGGYANGGTDGWTTTISSECWVGLRLYCFGVDRSAEVAPEPAAGRRAFLSAREFGPDLGLAGADALCQTEAGSSGLSGSFLAMLAVEGTAPVSRFDLDGSPWVRADGVLLVEDAADLATGLLVSAPSVQADGETYLYMYMWSGASNPTDVGTAAMTCDSWTSAASSSSGHFWLSGLADLAVASSLPCDVRLPRLLCLEE